MSRIAVVDRSRMRIVDVERRNTVDLSAAADSRLANRQPAWSPDGARLAWSAFDRRQTDSPATLVIATPEGSSRVDHRTVFAPFYLSWRPDGQAIATLSESPIGLELALTHVRSGASEILLRNAPVFFCWSPTGTMAVHSGVGDTARLLVTGSTHDADAFGHLIPGTFSAPAFVENDDVLAVLRQPDGAALVIVDREARVAREISRVEHGARFCVDATGQWIAFTSDRSLPGPLLVHHLGTDTLTFVDEHSPALFAWSPDSTMLLFARVVERGDFPVLEWCTWANGEVQSHTRARTTPAFGREVLPFHEQFARSHSWWSPANDAFCFAALDDFNNETVWVTFIARSPPERLVTGSHAVWSPT